MRKIINWTLFIVLFHCTLDVSSQVEYNSNSSDQVEFQDSVLRLTITENIAMPQSVRNSGDVEVVYASFFVSKHGTIDTSWISHSNCQECGQNIQESISSLSVIQPVKYNGMEVDVQLVIPIIFVAKKDYNQEVNFAYDSLKIKSVPEISEHVFYGLPLHVIEYKIALPSGYGNPGPYIDRSALFKDVDEAIENKDFKTALNKLNILYRGDPTNAEILYKRGGVKFQMQKIKGACKDWQNAMNKGNKKAEALFEQHCETGE